MTEIRFYHLQKQTLDQALPQILEKALQANRRVVVRMESPAEAERMCTILWTYKADAFLPHGNKKDGHAASQLVWLTDTDENPNQADMIVLTQGMETSRLGEYALCCEMLDGQNDDQIANARKRWKSYADAGHTVTYWHQNESGKWDKKGG